MSAYNEYAPYTTLYQPGDMVAYNNKAIPVAPDLYGQRNNLCLRRPITTQPEGGVNMDQPWQVPVGPTTPLTQPANGPIPNAGDIPTPRTDDAQFGTGRVTLNFARTLERELAACQNIKASVTAHADREIGELKKKLATTRQQLADDQTLIITMRCQIEELKETLSHCKIV